MYVIKKDVVCLVPPPSPTTSTTGSFQDAIGQGAR